MGKLLLWIVIILTALGVARYAGRRIGVSRPVQAPARPAKKTKPRNAEIEPMVRCAHCGVHLPRSEAVLLGGNTWCSSQHAQRGVRHHQ